MQDQEEGLLVLLLVVPGEEVPAEEGDLGGEESGVEHPCSHVEDGREVAAADGAQRLLGGGGSERRG